MFVEIQFRAAFIVLEQVLDLCQSGANGISYLQIHNLGKCLPQLAYDKAGLPDDFTLVRLQFAHDQLQRCRLASAIATDQANTFARLNGEFGVAQNDLPAKFHSDFVEPQQ